MQIALKKDEKIEVYHRYPGSFALVKLALRNAGRNEIVFTGGENPITFVLKPSEAKIISFDGNSIIASGDSVLEIE